jgi:predicted amidohydrolase YtcJ
MVTVNAARAGKLSGRQAGLVAGERADFTLFHFDAGRKAITVEATYVGGEKVWAM